MTKSKKKRERTGFEWLVLSIALAATMVVVGSLSYFGLTASDAPPRFDLTIEEVPGSGAERSFEVEVANVGGSTAEEVVVTVTAGSEEREVLIKAVAKGDSETFTVLFPADLTEQPAAAVKSYKES